MSTENPYRPPEADVSAELDSIDSQIVEPNWNRVIPVWWSFYWRATLLGGILGAVLGGVVGFVFASVGRADLAAMAGAVSGYILGIPVSMLCIKIILGKSFGGFSVRLVRH